MIKNEADEILKELDIQSLCEPYGKLFYTGSYALDLMTWNDIDMLLLLKEGVDEEKALLYVLENIISHPGFIKSKLIRFKGDYKPAMPRGLYLGLYLNFPKEWKLDLWCLEKEDFDRNKKLIEQLQKKMTPEKRKLILELKRELQAEKGRMPQMGSHFLYQAVLLKNLVDKEEIYSFLKIMGVSI